MHTSLDSALGRQRRLNQVGESITQIAPDPAAAYSLRSLTGSDPKVVRVRRGSDNHEQDFTASEVSAGALTSFVNAQVVAPLDIQALEADGRTGDFLIAKAAYSLRSLGTRQATLAATGDTVARADGKFVAQVRRNVNGDVKSFTADEVTDGTLTSFVNESFTSSLPLDVAGSAAAAYGLRNLSSSYTGNVVEVRRSSDDTTQNFKAAEITDGTLRDFCLNDDADIISFADAGLAGSPAANKRMYFDGANDNVDIGSPSFDPKSAWTVSFSVIANTTDTNKYIYSQGSSSSNTPYLGIIKQATAISINFRNDAGSSTVSASSDSGIFDGGLNHVEIIYNGSGSLTFNVNGVLNSTKSWNPTGDYTVDLEAIGCLSRTSKGFHFPGVIYDIDLNSAASYKGYGNTSADWTDQIGSSNGTVVGSPALFTGQGFDGFVKTWYDQSGNSNDATQATAASQPKIVSAGAYLGEVDFGGTDDVLNFTSIDFSTNPWFAASVFKYDNTASTIIGGGSTQWITNVGSSSNYSARNTQDSAIHNFVSSSAFVNGSVNLVTVFRTGDTLSGSDNGNLDSTASPVIESNDTFQADRLSLRGSTYGTFSIKEVIIYNSDQSDKRRAIEESIATANGITLGSFSRDGFVKTWYDQSVTNEAGDTATGNHATQATAASQPKIVDGGALVSGGIDFDGVDDGLFTASNLTDTLQSATFFAVTQDDNTSGTASMVRIRPNGSSGTLDGLVWEKRNNETYGAVTLIEGADGAVQAASAGQGTRNTSKNLNTLVYQQSEILAYENGALDATLNTVTAGSAPVGDVTLVDQLWIGENFDSNDRPFNGTMSEIIIYFTDQTDNRTALEANIGEVYSIDLPSGVDPGFDQVDGFVETWYDQSGNGKDATQATAGRQPKIVDGGALVTSGGLPAIDNYLSNSGIMLETGLTGLQNTNYSHFAVFNTASTEGTGMLLGMLTPNPYVGAIQNGSSLDAQSSQVTNIPSYYKNGALLVAPNRGALHTAFHSSEVVLSSIELLTTSDTLWLNDFGILTYKSDALVFSAKTLVSEWIIYDSDQSANRPALETNIASEYGITLS